MAYSVSVTPPLGDAGAGHLAYYKTVCAYEHVLSTNGHRPVAALKLLLRSSGTSTGLRHVAQSLRAAGLQQGGQESNLQPPVLETGALPIELPPLVHGILSARAPADLTVRRAHGLRERTGYLHLRRGAQEASTLARWALPAARRRLRGRRDLVRTGQAMDRARGLRGDRGLVLGACLPLAEVSV